MKVGVEFPAAVLSAVSSTLQLGPPYPHKEARNFPQAKEHIKKDMYVILVESPGNVWKLEENGIHNSVAIFGTNLSNQQKLLLDSSGAMCIFTIMDNDDAGQKAAQNIYKNCNRTYNVYNIEISANDIADMSPDQIDVQIKKTIQEYL